MGGCADAGEAGAARLPRIAIACQGGGSHTAFTAGVLQQLLAAAGADGRFTIAGFSGSSGGAICALLAWYGLLLGSPAEGVRLLEDFWHDNAAETLPDQLLNEFVLGSARLRDHLLLPELSPYDVPNWGQDQLRSLLEWHVEFERIPQLTGPGRPSLFVGAVDVLAGCARSFRDAEITVATLLASTATPTLFRAVRVGAGHYWDGLFTQNPPIRELAALAPDELWVVQINPCSTPELPRTLDAIRDRHGELAGHLALEQALGTIELVNRLLASGELAPGRFRPIRVHRLQLARTLDHAAKRDRNPAFLRGLMREGRQVAAAFLEGWSGDLRKPVAADRELSA